MTEREHEVKKLFQIIRTTTHEEQEEYVIVIGKHLATEAKFSSREEAEEFIESKDYDLIWALIAALIDAKDAEEMEVQQEKDIQEVEEAIQKQTIKDL
nr:MAG TPA: hypothetical protein [Bacteriophage sp.]